MLQIVLNGRPQPIKLPNGFSNYVLIMIALLHVSAFESGYVFSDAKYVHFGYIFLIPQKCQLAANLLPKKFVGVEMGERHLDVCRFNHLR